MVDDLATTVTGKSATLEYIRSPLSDIPIPPFVPVPAVVSAQPTLLDKLRLASSTPAAREERRLAKSIGYPLIVRSDAKYEDGLGRSFAGLFDSLVVNHEQDLDAALMRVRAGTDTMWSRVHSYAKTRNLVVERSPIDVIFQKYVPAQYRGIITEHPNVEGGLFVDIEELPTEFWPKAVRTGMYFSSARKAIDAFSCNVVLSGDMVSAIKDYLRVRELFPKDISYQAEVTLRDYAFVQWRPFRKKTYASFALDDVVPRTQMTADIAFPIGITPPEGVLLGPTDWQSSENRISCERISESNPPKASFYIIEQHGLDGGLSRFACAPWQAHDLFRFMEQDVCVGFTSYPQLAKLDAYARDRRADGKYGALPIRYWSDGRKGRVAPE